ncbi:MAG TPA: tRNA lysidine(34) synthetase TilS [Chlorobaculum parvum]|uniref:tRNA(Ile)-lysidine synthase n=1 Tax=Chlorobaculum parvum TaxID=274539 RepID=A0A7C5DDH2_9CHLB|nr:tRNA lysidine(34) synthetase TilS [Chlorobaculum parvum]
MNRTEKQFLEYIRRQGVVSNDESVLVAVSGGPDSMALLHLLIVITPVLHLRLGVAHCNFGLRGKESDGDEAFVRESCLEHGLTCHVRRFDTKAVAKAWKKSIEETARELRYDFFAELCREKNYKLIATGHHSGDNAETMLFNLFRGTAVAGLRGIRSRQGRLIRPLIPFSRQQIIGYLNERGIAWRTDRTNAGLEHDRNYIRNRVIPVIEERFRQKLAASLDRVAEHAGELEEFMEQHIDRLIAEHPGLDLAGGKLHVGTLLELTRFERKELLKRVLQVWGLPVESRVLNRIAGLLETQPGRRVYAGPGVEVVWKDGFLRFEEVPPDASVSDGP